MAIERSALTELLDALRFGGDDLDFMREAMQLALRALIDLEPTQVIGAARYERRDTRTTIATAAGECSVPLPALSVHFSSDALAKALYNRTRRLRDLGMLALRVAYEKLHADDSSAA